MSAPNLFDHVKRHWHTAPRYTLPTVSFTLGSWGFLNGHWLVALLLLIVMLCSSLRLTKLKLLPHEKKRLKQASTALHLAKPTHAIDILKNPLFFTGTHYQLKRTVLLFRAYCSQGQLIEAHSTLLRFKQKHLLPDEKQELLVAWAQLYLAADNPTEARRRLKDIAKQRCMADLNCLLTLAELELWEENFTEARILLESGLDRYQESEARVLLHNNFATLELLQNRTDSQLRHLLAARQEFNRNPRIDLTNIIHHNLAFALVRDGQPEKAKVVLDEALAAGDGNDLQHVLNVLNNRLEAAREAEDTEWIQSVYTEFDYRLEQLLKLATPQEQLILDISKLRMHRNDSIKHTNKIYIVSIERLLSKLTNPTSVIPLPDLIGGLISLREDLNQEIQNEYPQSGKWSEQLFTLKQQASAQLLQHSEAIDTYLSNISPLLTGSRMWWHKVRRDTDKTRIELAENVQQRQKGFTRFFNHLREKADWLSEQGTAQQAAEAWLILCDELIAYHELLSHTQEARGQEYVSLAQHALEQATCHMEKMRQKQSMISQMIGLAYFHLRLRNDKMAAVHWINIVHSYRPSMHHYAVWLRKHYEYVCMELEVSAEVVKQPQYEPAVFPDARDKNP